MSDAREVVARALFAWRYPGVEFNEVIGRWALDQADAVLAALAADPDTVERAARGMYEARFGTSHFLPWDELPEDMAPFNRVYYRRAARAALAAALRDGVVGERDGGAAVPLPDQG